jgi:NTE family protein
MVAPVAMALLLAACQTAAPPKSGGDAAAEPAEKTPSIAPSGVSPPPETSTPPPAPPPAAIAVRPVRVGLALGGGAARGFAHVGVIKALEANGIHADIVVGTSAGSFVAALYAAGYSGTELEKVAEQFNESSITDWSLPARGLLKGQALQDFVNRAVRGRPIESMNRKLGIVATDLNRGSMVVFERGNVGMAVRASSAVPGVFQPTAIDGRDYVDGGLVSPVPAAAARRMGADVVIAVDISRHPDVESTKGTMDILLQTFNIMERVIALAELPSADVVLHPAIDQVASTDFHSRDGAMRAGAEVANANIDAIRRAIEKAHQGLETAAQGEGARAPSP